MIAQSIKLNQAKHATIADVLDDCGMNWIAQPQELITAAGINVPKHKAIVREDTKDILGIVGGRYKPVQNTTAFAFLDTLIKDEKATYEYCYAINGGSRTIVQAKIDGGTFEARKNDRVDSYITMINSFDGTTPFKVFFTPVRLWCQNQLNAALRQATSSMSIRHTATAEARAEEAFEVFGKAKHYFDEFKKTAQALAQHTIDSKMIDTFLNECLGKAESTRNENRHTEVKRLAESGKGNNGSSLWDIYNGLTEYVDHHSAKNEEKRLASALVGSGYNLKAKAWNTAVAMI